MAFLHILVNSSNIMYLEAALQSYLLFLVLSFLQAFVVNADDATESDADLDDSRSPASRHWSVVDNSMLVYTPPDVIHRPKIASFDMDWTLIRPTAGGAFPANDSDWVILFDPEIPNMLQRLHEAEYKIVLFTNQKGVLDGPGRGHGSVRSFTTKIEEVIAALGVPAQALVATRPDHYRKPKPGMWHRLVDHENGGIPIDIRGSFFVGDAAGRLATQKYPKKDFACSDRQFAQGIRGLRFYTPEAIFLNKSEYRPFNCNSQHKN